MHKHYVIIWQEGSLLLTQWLLGRNWWLQSHVHKLLCICRLQREFSVSRPFTPYRMYHWVSNLPWWKYFKFLCAYTVYTCAPQCMLARVPATDTPMAIKITFLLDIYSYGYYTIRWVNFNSVIVTYLKYSYSCPLIKLEILYKGHILQ